MAAERAKRVVKKPNRFAEEFSRSMAVKKTEARKRDKKLYDVEVAEVDKVNKRIKIHFVAYSTQFDEWRFFRWWRGTRVLSFYPKRKAIYSHRSVSGRPRTSFPRPCLSWDKEKIVVRAPRGSRCKHRLVYWSRCFHDGAWESYP